MFIMAVDPGDVHVGVAVWPGNGMEREAWEIDAEEALDKIDYTLKMIQASKLNSVLVVEEFRLYPDRMARQGYSAMETPQMIGALKWIAQQRDARVVEQGAGIKKPTRAQLRARGIELIGRGTHVRDAELHLLHFMLKNELKVEGNAFDPLANAKSAYQRNKEFDTS